MVWIKVSDQKPPCNTFYPLWFWDGKKVLLGRHIGLNIWTCGEFHGHVTHWAQIEVPESPEAWDERTV